MLIALSAATGPLSGHCLTNEFTRIPLKCANSGHNEHWHFSSALLLLPFLLLLDSRLGVRCLSQRLCQYVDNESVTLYLEVQAHISWLTDRPTVVWPSITFKHPEIYLRCYFGNYTHSPILPPPVLLMMEIWKYRRFNNCSIIVSEMCSQRHISQIIVSILWHSIASWHGTERQWKKQSFL